MGRRILIFITCSLLALTSSAQLSTQVVWGDGTDLHVYKFAYVMPTSGMTSSSGGSGFVSGNHLGVFGVSHNGATTTINPSEKISGYLMKMGYVILPSITPEFADKTMVITYGNTGNKVIIQMRDAKTQDLVLSLESGGFGVNEADAASDAIDRSMLMFKYCKFPEIDIEILEEYNLNVLLYLTNRTPSFVKKVLLRVNYYLDGELVHEQTITINTKMLPGEEARVTFKRPKGFRSYKMDLKYRIESYN